MVLDQLGALEMQRWCPSGSVGFVAGDAVTADRLRVLLQEAKQLEQAGAFALVLEVVPAELAPTVTSSLGIPVIGIGAGASCDAQVLVWQDLMGLSPDRGAKFVKQYHNLYATMLDSVRAWGDEVVSGTYPDDSLHAYR